ncbi:Gamma-glutamyl phosphate reductase [Roseimaritima multifibrata]|uniref:Gamma-glutamyl phosphate reductase n=1 Tax=Roseimaritima multifibrata TaxID=1930274 RepID=A0A517MCM2_9BACT|nr:glutamate-5-semialdehyde dehydrogenase [Roseimaritima multifibrata]QDS92640.1 Gamma-glutamyl phosphate reductase [Roseimaritima multifibrata]
MATAAASDLQTHCSTIAQRAHEASRELAGLDTATKNAWLLASADALVAGSPSILAANKLDIEAAPSYGLSDAQVDRLVLNDQRIAGIATALREIAALPDPCGEIIEGQTRPNGLQMEKVRVPLGVVFFIYESRPNVTADAAAICVKSGNAVILRGGKEAAHSSQAIVEILQQTAATHGVPAGAVQLVDTPDRDAVGYFLKMDQWIDVAIPRGGEGLIRRVASEAAMPVIKHFDGNCHVYVDADADLEMAVNITENAKCHRMGVCNACESLLVHQAVAEQFLPLVAERLKSRGVELRGDQRACAITPMTPASEEDFGAEFLGPVISVAVVDDLQQAIDHIDKYGSHHTDAIVTKDLKAARTFTAAVDSAAVIVNASTRFNDGGEFGLGAEIGISTDKFHARGPCGLRELTTYKYVVYGDGHIRG